MSVDFLVLSLIVIVAPGTGVIYTLGCGLAGGARCSMIAAFGCTIGIVPHLGATVFGLTALLHASAVAFQTVKFAGVAYLIYLAWGALREKTSHTVGQGEHTRSWSDVMIKGFLINILNPKLSVFFLAFLPQFINQNGTSPTFQMLTMGAVFMAMTLIVFIAYGMFAASVRTHVIARPRVLIWFHRAIAGAFFSLGLKLAFTER